MLSIAISRALIGGRNTLHLATTWVSNGHWAVHRSILNNAALCTPEAAPIVFRIDLPRELEDAKVEALITKAQDGHRSWRITPWVHEQPRQTRYRLVVAVDNGEPAFFDNAYVTALGFADGDKLYGDTAGPFVDAPAEATRMLMPYKANLDVEEFVSVATYVTTLPDKSPKFGVDPEAEAESEDPDDAETPRQPADPTVPPGEEVPVDAPRRASPYTPDVYDKVFNNLTVDDAGCPDADQEPAVQEAIAAGFPEAAARAALAAALTDIHSALADQSQDLTTG